MHDPFGKAEHGVAAPVWHVQLLGGMRATRDPIVLAQFPSRAVAMLLARLALYPRRRHAREELIELLWPGLDPDVGRNRLRQVLSTLRRLLELPGDSPSAVLVADRQSIGLQPGALTCDVQEFEHHLRAGAVARALHCYRGDLLPGYVDEWVEDERLRLRSLFDTAQARSDTALARGGASEGAPAAHPYSDRAAPALPSMPATHDAPVRNLPAFVSVFFGREVELRCVHHALAAHRLVTVSGFGGCGKTRLAVEAARAAGGVDTVAFAALAECHDPGQIAERIRSALRMQAAQEDALAQLSVFLADRDVLLVLDNFEQLVEAGGAQVVVDLLARLPRLRCLVTSRRVLDVAGECCIALDPLPLPDAAMDIAEAAATPSVALFIDRARSARADFALTERNRAALIELSRALEGLPLAIEIAASRVRAYSPAEMCAALARRYELLARHGPSAPRHGRHASLQTTVDWSWQLLAPARQRFLAALSVFRGGCTAVAVESVCATGDAHRQLEGLVADSLLLAADDGGTTRFSMLETIREYAHERIGDQAPVLRARHRAHYLDLARQCAGRDATRVAAELANLQQAMGSAVEDADPAVALDIALALRPYWDAHGMPPALVRLLHAAQARCEPDDPRPAALLELLAVMTLQSGDTTQAHAYASAALERSRDPTARAAALVGLARIGWEREQRAETVEPLLEEALALASTSDALCVQADALRVWGLVTLRHGAVDADHARADELLVCAEALYARAGEPSWIHRTMLLRGSARIVSERYDQAQALLDACETYFEPLRSSADLIVLANMRGFLESCRQHWPEALAAGQRCVQLAWEGHAHLWLAIGLWNLPQPLVALGEIERAARLKAFSAPFWERHIGVLSADDIASRDSVRASAVERFGEGRTAALWDAGARLSLAEAVALALRRPDS